jgi:isoleucyl-tRNA synthetase
VVRTVQQARRDAGLAVSDRIKLTIGADSGVADAVRAHADFIARETLAVDVTVQPVAQVDAPAQPVGDRGRVKVAVEVTAAPMSQFSAQPS